MTQFDKLAIEVTPEYRPGKFAAAVVLYHRGQEVYREVFAENQRFTPLMAKVVEQCRIESTKMARHKYTADPVETAPTTKVD
jgi:hypothetical protein